MNMITYLFIGEIPGEILTEETQRRQYEGHNTPQGYYTDQGPQVYCCLSTASEVFLILLSNYRNILVSFFYLH